jgi:MEMO1 family protein
VKRFLDALTELRDREGDRLFWILGVDMAHMGARYQDKFECHAGEGVMQNVADRDEKRIALHQCARRGRLLGPRPGAARRLEVVRLVALLHLPQDGAEGYRRLRTAALWHFEQWNIDDRSVVSFAGMAQDFTRTKWHWAAVPAPPPTMPVI